MMSARRAASSGIVVLAAGDGDGQSLALAVVAAN
jgi:hypothetical protein